MVRTITVGGDPVGIASDGNHVRVANQESDNFIAFDARSSPNAARSSRPGQLHRPSKSENGDVVIGAGRGQVLDGVGQDLIERSVAPDHGLP